MKHILIILISFCPLLIIAQGDFVHTKAFDAKLKKYDLQYQEPSEIWLHPLPHEDEYDAYDLVLHAEGIPIEVRYIFRDDKSPIALSATPHLEFYRSVIDFASNEEEANEIRIMDMLEEDVQSKYNADWCLVADFKPKFEISAKPKGRILGIYKEERGLIFCIIFYGTDTLPDYFELPIKFN